MKQPRTKFQGLLQVLQFNWRFYSTAAIGLASGVFALVHFPLSPWFRAVVVVGLAFAAHWTVMSLAVSHWVYDRSGITEWQWIPETLVGPPSRWANIHAGFDESSPALHQLFPDSRGATLDIFDPVEMTEPSIAVARSAGQKTGSNTPADFRNLPLATNELNAVFLLFAAHEIRRSDSRLKFFNELRRVLKTGGRVILVEHLRDWQNFIAFGPGFTHFHSRQAWLDAVCAAGLTVAREFSFTPFVRVFVLHQNHESGTAS